MKKKNLGLKFIYHVDEKNRCVFCWLDYGNEDFYKLLEALINKYTGFQFSSAEYLKNFLPPDERIRAVAKTYIGDSWDPDGLKKLARMKAERSFYKRMTTAIRNLLADLTTVQHNLQDMECCYSRWFKTTNQKIVDPKFYENWRAKN